MHGGKLWSCISKSVHHLVQFGQISSHDGEVGSRLSYILDSLYEESVDHLTWATCEVLLHAELRRITGNDAQLL